MAPQGKSTPVSGFNPRIFTDGVFPLLPADAQDSSAYWKTDVQWNGAVTTFKPESGHAEEAGMLVFTGVQESPLNKIYLSSQQTMFTVDATKGVLTKAEVQHSQDYGVRATSMTTIRLEKDETIEPAKAEALGKEYAILFDADKKSDQLLERINDEPDHAEQLFTEAEKILADAAKQAKEPEVVEQFDQKTKEQAEYRQYILDDAKRLAGILNHPAADWAATDLDGKPFSMEALKGKVVVMDFWYRGCGWCMYAMPQVKQLAEDYGNCGGLPV